MENRNITFTAILLALGLLAFSQMVQAVVPAPDGGYPNFTTAEGTKALQSLTTGSANTAVGWFSLFSDAERQLQHRYRRGVAPFQHRRRQYGVWRGGAYYSTPPASTIPLLERLPFYTIRLPRKTRPLERSPFLATPEATSTRPSELSRCG